MEMRSQNGGWGELVGVPGFEGAIYVRLVKDDGGMWRVRELYLNSDEPISAKTLKALPLDLVELFVNEDDRIMLMADAPGPDLARLAAYGGTTFGSQADHWVKDSYLAQIKGSGVPQPRMPKRRPPRSEPERPPLAAPERLDGAFLALLAGAYVDVVSKRLPPAPTLAEEAGVSVRTVHRWIYEARKRGALPKGTQGKAGV